MSADAAMAIPADTLAPALQRKYDYFFLEAVRMKTLQKYDAAFDLLQYCLRIRPMLLRPCSNCPSTTWL